jgi:hypothetical protein
MINYKELSDDGVRFEQLIRELLVREDYDVRWTGVGADGGRDLLVTERASGPFAPFTRTWLISCKHKAHSGSSVGVNDLDRSIVDSCKSIGAEGFILACSTQASSALLSRLKEIEATNNLVCRVWDSVDIERRLMTPRTYSLMQIFFPETTQSLHWTVFNAGTPTFWCGSHAGHFFYMSSRIPAGVPRLKDMEEILKRLQAVRLAEPGKFGQQEHLRMRGVNFDNKNENYMAFADYLVPTKRAAFGNEIMQQTQTAQGILRALNDGHGLYSDGQHSCYSTYWDVIRIPCFQLSDRFDADSKDFYTPFMSNFETGFPRKAAASAFTSRATSWD